MSRPAALYRTLGPVGVVAVAASVLALVVAAFGARSLMSGLVAPSGAATPSEEAAQDRVNRYALALDNHVKQVDGRSLFFIPSEPSKPPPPAPVKPPDGPPQPPPPPSKYGGPAIIGMYGGSIWFEDGKWLKQGETSAGGVKLLRLDAPWSARVEWKGVEFDVPLFERDKIVSKPPPAPPATVTPPASTASADGKPPEAKPGDAPGGETKPAGEATPTGETKPAPPPGPQPAPEPPPPTPPSEQPPAPPKDAPPAPDRIGEASPSPESPTPAAGAASPGQDTRP